MPFLLRGITRTKWYKGSNESQLADLESELQADALVDLRTRGNTLSFWHIEDDKSNFNRVVTAFTAQRDDLDEFAYALINLSLVIEIGIKLDKKLGETPDSIANAWHRDMVELTAFKLCNLAQVIHLKSERDRFLPKDVKDLLIAGVAHEHLNRSLMKPSLLKKLGLQIL